MPESPRVPLEYSCEMGRRVLTASDIHSSASNGRFCLLELFGLARAQIRGQPPHFAALGPLPFCQRIRRCAASRLSGAPFV